MSLRSELRREEAKEACRRAAFTPARQGCDHCDHMCGPKPEPMIHCVSPGGFGADWTLRHVLEEIDRTEQVYWSRHWMGHDFVIMIDGKAWRFDVPIPERPK